MLPKFDKEKYFKDAEAVLAQRKTVEEVADKVCEEGFSNIVLLGIGGTEFELGPIEYQIKKYSNIDVELVNAADANTVHPKKITKDTLVITASASGDTVEIVEAAKWIVEIGAHVVAFTKKEKPLGQIVQTVIEAEVTTGGCEFSYVLFDLLAFRILHNKGTFLNMNSSQKEWMVYSRTYTTLEFNLMTELKRLQKHITMHHIQYSQEVVQHGAKQYCLQCAF